MAKTTSKKRTMTSTLKKKWTRAIAEILLEHKESSSISKTKASNYFKRKLYKDEKIALELISNQKDFVAIKKMMVTLRKNATKRKLV